MPSSLSLKLCLRCIQRDFGWTLPSDGGGVVGSALIDCKSESSVRPAEESADDESALAVASFIDGQITTIDVLAVQGLNCLIGIFLGFHGDEREAARATAHFVHDQIDVCDRAMCCKQVLQVVFSGVEGKISHKQFSIHF